METHDDQHLVPQNLEAIKSNQSFNFWMKPHDSNWEEKNGSLLKFLSCLHDSLAAHQL